MRATLDVLLEEDEDEMLNMDDGPPDMPVNVVSETPGFLDCKADLNWSSLADGYGKGSEMFIRCEACLVALNAQNTTITAASATAPCLQCSNNIG